LTGDQFTFNLGTKNMTTGTWRLTARLEVDGVTIGSHEVLVAIR
jgi:hypothetical protein